MFSRINSKLHLNKRLYLLVPFLVITILLIILPIILIINSSLRPLESNGELNDNWELLKQPTTWTIIFRSLRIGIWSSILCLVVGFPYAYFVSSSDSKIFKIYAISLILSPLAIFTIARIYSVRTFFVNVVDSEYINSLNSEWFLVIGLFYLNLPLMVMPLYTVLKDMPKNILEASADMGYNTFQTLLKVVVPYSLKAILAGFGMIFLSSATTFIVSAKLLPNGSQHQTIGDIINSRINPGNPFDLAKGSSLVIVVSGIFIGIYSLVLVLPRIIMKFKKGAYYE
ncbi:ABC transporter permease [Mycoplasmopsis ciconiae]|uniref:ABC transporter permease n=1 Tax=Mycoplasmopsis ciconiae TaxID=561067 RepID=A0ABU7MKC6_9BACT|nr:ABC transporter permease [Mycoplasmopsis ciconiae]